MNRKSLPPEATDQYPNALKVAREAAKAHGYAIGVHGSLTFDLDLIAAPWAEVCSEPKDLAFAIADALGWYLHPDIASKPHGRVCFLIYGSKSAHIDLSVMPRG